MTETASGVWTYTIPGQGSTNPATWKRGSAAISILPPASISSTPLYTNSAGFTVS
jgi:hypothetical protein